jgi:hypothetical protein
MISKLLKNGVLALASVLTVGCNAPGPAASQDVAIHVGELPELGGCERLAAHQSQIRLIPIAEVDDLYLVKVAGEPSCIDSLAGARRMIVRLAGGIITPQERASSNPMPGEDPESTTNSNPMPGSDPASSDGDGNSNPMPGSDPIKP